MRLLVLGGTLFLGRHLVEVAIARGHDVTLFHRGKTGADLFPEVARVHGDRDGGIGALGDRAFDAVVDTCGYVPRVVAQSAAHLAGRCGFYVFVSSMSVYAEMEAGSDETAPLAELAEPGSEDVQEHYGPLKVLCEQAVEERFPGRAQHARAGFLVGPHDRIDRFPYWVRRLSEGGPTLAPGRPEAPVQWIDVRDLAAWLVTSAEERRAGPFNLTSPPMAVGDGLDTMNATLGGRAELVWPGDAFLEEHDVEPGDGLPYWLPAAFEGFCRRDVSRALAAGLSFRPLEETTRDTAAWIEREGFSRGSFGVSVGSKMTTEREQELLALL